jgi:hypothetical protein
MRSRSTTPTGVLLVLAVIPPLRRRVLTLRDRVVRRARHPYLISVDMDLSVDLTFVEDALDLLETHDIVVGAKKVGLQKRSAFRKLGSDSFLWVVRLLLGLPYDDYSIAAKAFRVELLRRFRDRIDAESTYVLEICLHAARSGARIVQVPVGCEDWRISKFNLLREARSKYAHLLALWWRRDR